MESVKSPTIAEIDLKALGNNLKQVQGLIPKGGEVLAVVKANAYGHGAVQVSKYLEKKNIDIFGVAYLKEAQELREAGISKEVLIFGGITEEEVESAVRYNVTPVILTRKIAAKLDKEGKREKKIIPVHIEIETGMGRLGISSDEALAFVSFIKTLPNLRLEGIMTHFAESESSDKLYTSIQIELFRKTVDTIIPDFKKSKAHSTNSGALIQHPKSFSDLSRIGLMLYGYQPGKINDSRLNLKPVMTLKTRVIFVKEVKRGTSISYGRTFTAPKKMKIATIACGYADGLNRGLSNCGEVLIRGKRAPITGRICMDQTMVDVTHIDGAAEGDEAVIIGIQGKETITADDIAAKLGTIPYEVLCAVSKRVDRIFV